jgi:hypothetical protein
MYETQLKEYIVTAKTMEDADSIIEDMESPGGNLYIPNRTVDIAQLRVISRNTHFMLTDDEAAQLRNDSRVLAVNLTPREMGMEVVRYWQQTGNFEKSSAIDSNDKNWGLYRITAGNPLLNWGTNGSFTQSTQTIITTSSGKNVDVVIVDAHINPNHPEFAVNPDGTGGTRVNQFNWFSLSSYLGISTTGPYDYSDISSNHGTHVAGTAAGNTQGWARDATIYNMEIDYVGTNSLANWQLYIFDYLRAFHKTKPINSVTGRRNPTITNHSWGYSYPSTIPLSLIFEVTFRGVTTNIVNLNAEDKKTFLQANGCLVSGNNSSNYGLRRYPSRYPALDADVIDAIADGVVVVAAAGNSSWNCASPTDLDYSNQVRVDILNPVPIIHSQGSSPGAAPGVIYVGNISTSTQEYKSNGSNFGSRIDIWAPGTNIVSSVFNSTAAAEYGITLVDDPRNSSYKLGSISGTSMASPQVCGILACYAEQNQNLSNSEALAYLITNSKKNQIGSTGSNYGDTSWFGDRGNNRYLFYVLERPLSGRSFPRTTFKNRPTTGPVFPRAKIRPKG